MKPPEVAGELYANRLRKQVAYECRNWEVPMPSDNQISAVLHALADHSALMVATQYDRLDHFPGGDNEGKEDDLYPTELSIGRFLQRTADSLEA